MISIRYHEAHAPPARAFASSQTLQRALLGAGIVAAAVYIAIDLVSAMQYPGYSIRDQAISELSAVGAPTTGLWSAMGWVFGISILAFGIGVVRTANGNRALRTSGILLVTLAASGVLWSIVPMHERGAERNWQDLGHVAMGGLSSILILGFMATGGLALGRRFKAFSIGMLSVVLAFTVGTFSYFERMANQQPTPWLGVIERVHIYGYLVWIAVFAVALLRRSRTASG